MRRSCAPSARQPSHNPRPAFQVRNPDNQLDVPSSTSEIVSGEKVSKKCGELAVPSNNQLIFNIVWRETSTKKHKTWQGDGTLEVRGKRGVLKNDQGKHLGVSNELEEEELQEGQQLLVAGKEIELLERIKTKDEYWAMRKLQMQNRGWGDTEYEEEPKEKKPKGSFFFRPSLGPLPMPKRINKKSLKATTSLACTTDAVLVLPTAPDTMRNTLKEFNEPKAVREVRVAPSLAQHLRPHQRDGVAFVYACLMGFQVPNYSGCILADEMGLGKTLQCLTVAHTMLRQGPFNGGRVLQRVLIVTPSSLTANWNNEVNKWLKTERMYAYVVDGKHKLDFYAHQQHIPFIIVSYETLLARVQEFQQLSFDLLICDEGHRLKNSDSKLYSTLRELEIPRRLLLTGTPVQNDLQEFFTLADFVNAGIFGTKQEFRKNFELPIQKGQCPTASEEVRQLAAKQSAELNSLSAKFLLRRMQHINRAYLPKKNEYICFVRPSELQEFMLQKALRLYEERKDSILKDLSPLQIITVLKKICNHPSLIGRTKSPNLFTRNLERYLPDWSEMGPFDSAKLELVQHFLNSVALERREKCVLVSNHTNTLNMLQGLCDYLKLRCLRIEGATPVVERNAHVEEFNSVVSKDEDPALVFLLSAKAGGVGLNLTGASRLILFDNDWNPATDTQATSRIWRDGQRNDVHIYRLVTAGCIEEKIFQRQVAKLSLGDTVMQKMAQDTIKFSVEDLQDLFSLPQDFNDCQTHAHLGCDCQGDGQNLMNQDLATKNFNQINELSSWAHYQPPFNDAFLQEACLHNADNIVYIFANQTDT